MIGQLLRMEPVIRFGDETHDVKEQYFMLADGSGTRWLAGIGPAGGRAICLIRLGTCEHRGERAHPAGPRCSS